MVLIKSRFPLETNFQAKTTCAMIKKQEIGSVSLSFRGCQYAAPYCNLVGRAPTRRVRFSDSHVAASRNSLPKKQLTPSLSGYANGGHRRRRPTLHGKRPTRFCSGKREGPMQMRRAVSCRGSTQNQLHDELPVPCFKRFPTQPTATCADVQCSAGAGAGEEGETAGLPLVGSASRAGHMRHAGFSRLFSRRVRELAIACCHLGRTRSSRGRKV